VPNEVRGVRFDVAIYETAIIVRVGKDLKKRVNK
jgi:hypothetical protein